MSAAYRTIRIKLKAKPARKASWCVASVLAIEVPSPETTLIPLIPAIRKKTSLRPETTKNRSHTTPVGLAQEAFGYCFVIDRSSRETLFKRAEESCESRPTADPPARPR